MASFRITREQMSTVGRSEWLLTNGLGGFAMGTASGIPERRYHAWLIAATRPPLGRVSALHSCIEWIVVEGQGRVRRFDLASYRFTGGTVSPGGVGNLESFERESGLCRWTYEVRDVGIRVVRELTLAQGSNQAFVRYSIQKHQAVPGRVWLEVRPLCGLRDFHSLRRERPGYGASVVDEGTVQVTGDLGSLSLAIQSSRFVADPQWWQNFEYVRELERGQDGVEDLFSPGVFTCQCAERETSIELRAWQPGAVLPGGSFEATVGSRRRQLEDGLASAKGLEASASRHGVDGRAVLEAADQFVVKRQGAGRLLTSIIAGYPWFSDWGRDTVISMRGLLLCTGRFKEALEALQAFAALQQRGLIPNCFDDGSGAAEYNTVDASLWFVHTACEYLRMSGDRAGFATVRQACLNVIEAYKDGTEYDIRMDVDGLIAAGSVGTQLTWMDAKRDGVVFTPRHGKPVEVNALWYSGLLELAAAIEPDAPNRARELRQLADLAGRAFGPAFWNERKACLFDVLMPAKGDWQPNEQVRPNQIFAVSQPHSPLSKERRAAVVKCVRERLLTPVGLRTLDATDPAYVRRYEGPLPQRDAAYHNGTVWPWLMGPYCEAVLRVGAFSANAKNEASKALEPLIREFTARQSVPGPVRQLAEVYDAEPVDGVRRPEGCMAQAWSVGELIRLLGML
jgi:predicted glycogen debranching enzyme